MLLPFNNHFKYDRTKFLSSMPHTTPPEFLKSTNEVTNEEKVDVFMLGIVCMTILCGFRPFSKEHPMSGKAKDYDSYKEQLLGFSR